MGNDHDVLFYLGGAPNLWRFEEDAKDCGKHVHHGEDPDHSTDTDVRKEDTSDGGTQPDTDAGAKIEDR